MTDIQLFTEAIKCVSVAISIVGVSFAIAWVFRGTCIGK